MQKNSTTHTAKALILIVVFASGYLLSKFINFPVYFFKKELDVVGIATILVNILLAYYLSVVIAKQSDINKSDKQIVVNRISKIIENIESFNSTIRNNGILLFNITTFVKRNSIAIVRTCKSFSEFHTIDDNEEGNIIKEFKELNRLMTYTPPGGQNINNQPVIINNNIVNYSRERIDEILLKVDQIVDLIIKLQLTINSR